MALLMMLVALWSDTVVPPVSCGPATVMLAARLVDRPCSDTELSNSFQGCLDGEHSLQQLWDVVQSLGLIAREVSGNDVHRQLSRTPTIVPIRSVPTDEKTTHFVILYGRTDQGIQLLDPPYLPRFVTRESLDKYWDGTGFYVSNPDAETMLPAEGSPSRRWITLGAGVFLFAGNTGFIIWSLRRRDRGLNAQ